MVSESTSPLISSGCAAVGPAGLRGEAAEGQRLEQRVDGRGVAAVEVEGVFGQAQLPDLVGTEDRLRRVVEDVHDVLATTDEQPVERRQPAGIEVLPLVDHDRVVARPELPDRLVERGRHRLGEPVVGHRVRLLRQRPGLAPEVLGTAGGRC